MKFLSRLKLISCSVVLLLSSFVHAQNFEGSITYQVQMHNPMPDMIPDSVWQAQVQETFGDKSGMTQKYFYKGKQYMSMIDMGVQNGFQVYNPKDRLIYSWQKDSTEAITLDSRKYIDELVSIKSIEAPDTVMGIPCKAIVVESKMTKITLWYNSDYFKVDESLFKGHKYGHWEAIIKKTKCLPLKMETKGFVVHMVQTMVDYKEQKLDDKLFELPKFESIMKNPIN
jgi:hypothetical protein